MRKLLKRSMVLLLIAVLLVPVMWVPESGAAKAAATPAFSEKTVTINGIGETHQLVINNKIANSKYSWSSSSKTVAKVSKKGLVTAKASGKATIKCKITYAKKKTKTISCKVTVRIPAQSIQIAEVKKTNNAYQLTVGSAVDLEAVITPTNSSDKAYWYIDTENELSNPDCVTLDANNSGIVTGVKAGKAVIRVKAATSAAAASDIDDSIIIEVVAPTATVQSAEITSTNQITVVFDSPVQQSTVINSDGTLSSNITISLASNSKKITATDPGKLTAVLSSDFKTLTITSANLLQGTYGINFTSKILTTNGVALEEYYKQMSYTDTVPPDIASVTYDETGMIATINFTEPIDFTNLKISSAKLINTAAGTASSTTLAVLNNKLNYTASTDKKSLTINLSTMASTDYGKIFSIVISGITDLAGNYPASSYLTTYMQTDTTPKAQARPVTVIRTGYYTLTTTFDRAIQTPGYLMVGGSTITGVVNSSNNKQVNYTMNASQASLSGVNTVTIWGWNSYNVISSDTYASSQHTYSVNFATDTTAPVMVSYDYDIDTAILTLTYNEAVTLSAKTGVISATLRTKSDDITPGTNLSYSQISTTDQNVIKLQMSNITISGTYTFTLAAGFVTDSFLNAAASREITISNTSATSNALPGPYLIQQSNTNLSQIYIYFSTKLDKTTAETIGNYSIPGVKILSASLSENSTNAGVVLLTVADGSIGVSLEYPITINGIIGYNGSYTALSSFSSTVTLKDNAKPYIVATAFDKNSKNTVTFTFSEEIQGSMVVSVTQNSNGVSNIIGNTVSIKGNTIYVTLAYQPLNGSYLTFSVTGNSITDTSGNVWNATTPTPVSVSY